MDLHHLDSVALIGVIHGIAEVFDRSFTAFIDHIIHEVLGKRPGEGFAPLTVRDSQLTSLS